MSSSSDSSPAASSVGAYGFTITGPASVGRTGLVAVEETEQWPSVDLNWELGTSKRPASSFADDDHAVILLVEGEYAELDRRRRTVLIHTARELDIHDLVHPYLAAPAAVMAQWHGRLALHAGGVVVDDGVWALLGEKGAGKSTMLAACRARGLGVLADDLVVVDGSVSFAGPRSLDLRPETAEHLGASETLFSVRNGDRARLVLPPIAPQWPFRGCVALCDGQALDMHSVALVERLDSLQRHLVMSPHSQQRLLDLLALPMWSLRLPRRWDVLPQAVEALVANLSG